MEDYYTIQTADYHTTLLSELHMLQKQGVLCDVILAAEDGEVMAHKVVLMAASKYFREKISPIVSGTASRICLKGISVVELANLVKYIYTGKLLVAKETMDVTLEISEIIQLNGVIKGYKEIIAYEQMKTDDISSKSGIATVEYGQALPQAQGPISGQDVHLTQSTTRKPIAMTLPTSMAPITTSIDSTVVSSATTNTREQPPPASEDIHVTEYCEDGSTVTYTMEESEGCPVTEVQTFEVNTSQTSTGSNEYKFEFNPYDQQYMDISVGANQHGSPLKPPKLQKMLNQSAEEQAQHQDLLAVAIETLSGSPFMDNPSKEAELDSAISSIAGKPIEPHSNITKTKSTEPYKNGQVESKTVTLSAGTIQNDLGGQTAVYTVALDPATIKQPLRMPRQHKKKTEKEKLAEKKAKELRQMKKELLENPFTGSTNAVMATIVDDTSGVIPLQAIEGLSAGNTLLSSTTVTPLPEASAASQPVKKSLIAMSPSKKAVDSSPRKRSTPKIILKTRSPSKRLQGKDVDETEAALNSIISTTPSKTQGIVDTDFKTVKRALAGSVMQSLDSSSSNEGNEMMSSSEQPIKIVSVTSLSPKKGKKETYVSDLSKKQVEIAEDFGQSVNFDSDDDVDMDETIQLPIETEKKNRKSTELIKTKKAKSQVTMTEAATSIEILSNTGITEEASLSEIIKSPKEREGSNTEHDDEMANIKNLDAPIADIIRSSASKRKGKVPRRLPLPLDTLSSNINKKDNVPLARTRRNSKSLEASFGNIKSQKSPKLINSKSKDPELTTAKEIHKSKSEEETKDNKSIDEEVNQPVEVSVVSLKPIEKAETEKSKIGSKKKFVVEKKMLPHVILQKHSTEDMMALARSIAASSPKKKSLEEAKQIELEIECFEAEENTMVEKDVDKSTASNQSEMDGGELITEDEDSQEEEIEIEFEFKNSIKKGRKKMFKDSNLGPLSKKAKGVKRKVLTEDTAIDNNVKKLKASENEITDSNIFDIMDTIKPATSPKKGETKKSDKDVVSVTKSVEHVPNANVKIVVPSLVPRKKTDNSKVSANKSSGNTLKQTAGQPRKDNVSVVKGVGPAPVSKGVGPAPVSKGVGPTPVSKGVGPAPRSPRKDAPVLSNENLVYACPEEECMFTSKLMTSIRRHLTLFHGKSNISLNNIKAKTVESITTLHPGSSVSPVLHTPKIVVKRQQGFVCSCCSITFKSQGLLKQHMLIKKQREILCQLCEKMFGIGYLFYKHQLLQHNIQVPKEFKKYECPYCDYKCDDYDTMDTHATSCEDYEREGKQRKQPPAIKCEDCDYTCQQIPAMKEHIRQKHSKPAFRCKFCKYGTTLAGNYRKHLSGAHGLLVVTKTTNLKTRDLYGGYPEGTILTKDGEVFDPETMPVPKHAQETSLNDTHEKMEEDNNDIELVNDELPAQEPRIMGKKTTPHQRKRVSLAKLLPEEFTKEMLKRHEEYLNKPEKEFKVMSKSLAVATAHPSFPQASPSVRGTRANKLYNSPKLRQQYQELPADATTQFITINTGHITDNVTSTGSVPSVASEIEVLQNDPQIVMENVADNYAPGVGEVVVAIPESGDFNCPSDHLIVIGTDGKESLVPTKDFYAALVNKNSDVPSSTMGVISALLEAGEQIQIQERNDAVDIQNN